MLLRRQSGALRHRGEQLSSPHRNQEAVAAAVINEALMQHRASKKEEEGRHENIDMQRARVDSRS